MRTLRSLRIALVLSVGSTLCAQQAIPAWDFSFTAERPAPAHFAVDVPEGNFLVTVTLALNARVSVQAELRRLMVESAQASVEGGTVRKSFLVNVRTPVIPGGGQVLLKDREKTTEKAAWDGQLSLDFLPPQPAVSRIQIVGAPQAPTLFIIGDSTVADQPLEPYASWGQMFPRFLGTGLAVANHSESGESLTSFIAENRLAKVMSLIRAGDFLMVEMGHNDQKLRGPGVGPHTSYQAQLRTIIQQARQKGVFPILITPVNRRTFDAAGLIVNSLGDFPSVVRRTAQDEQVPLIDLHLMSKAFYEALGPERSVEAFAPGDGTHHNSYGAYELARCVAEAIRAQKLPLAQYLAADGRPFDPARPDPVDVFRLGNSREE